MDPSQDEQYLNILSIFHYVVGGIAGLFACFPIIHLVLGIGLLVSSFNRPSLDTPPTFVGLIFVLVAGGFILTGWAFAICVILAGRYIAKRKNHTFCLVMAGVECIFTPFGTVLGVFTIITLIRPSVRGLFETPASGFVKKAA